MPDARVLRPCRAGLSGHWSRITQVLREWATGDGARASNERPATLDRLPDSLGFAHVASAVDGPPRYQSARDDCRGLTNWAGTPVGSSDPGDQSCPHCRCWDHLTPSMCNSNVTPGTPAPMPAYGFRFVPSACEHCFCRVVSDRAIPLESDLHEECCNCGVRRKKEASL